MNVNEEILVQNLLDVQNNVFHIQDDIAKMNLKLKMINEDYFE